MANHTQMKERVAASANTRSKPTSKILDVGYQKTCNCKPNHLNCLTAKEWIKCQLGVWQFNYEKRDVRDKEQHPATFPISLASKIIGLFSHKGELVLDPFNGSGTTLVATRDLSRNAVGFDINKAYCDLSNSRLSQQALISDDTKQITVRDDAHNISEYLPENSVALSITSPPYANLLNRARKNKSRRGDERKNGQYLKVEQYSQEKNDLGTLSVSDYQQAVTAIYKAMMPVIRSKGHVIINIADMWWEGTRVPLHLTIIKALEDAGYVFKNTIIWDRTNIVNRIGIFGWPSNYITMGTTFEFILDFYKPEG